MEGKITRVINLSFILLTFHEVFNSKVMKNNKHSIYTSWISLRQQILQYYIANKPAIDISGLCWAGNIKSGS